MNKAQVKLFLRFTKLLLPYWKKEILLLGLSGAVVLLGLVNPYLTKLVVDKALGNKDLRIFIILALIGGAVFIINGLVGGLKDYLDRQIKIKVNFDLNKKVFKYLEKLDLDYFQNRSTGEHLYKASYDIDRVSDFITTALPDIITLLPRVLFILAVVVYLNWKMAVFSLILAPFLYLPPYYFTKKLRGILQDLFKNSENIFKRLSETFSNIRLVKVFGREGFETRTYLRKLVANIRIRMRNVRLEILSGFAGGAINRVIIALITFYGGYQVIKGRMTLGSLTAIMIYISQLIGLQGNFAFFFQRAMLGLVSCERLEKILDEESKIIEAKGTNHRMIHKPCVEFRDVSFGYRKDKLILQNLSFNIKSGAYVAFVGHSGCGKTTILNLILRLYDPWSGDIFIGGYNVKEIRSSSLREQIGVALQEPLLWNDSVENNIRYGKPGAKEQEIIELANTYSLDGFINKLPNKYKTIIGEKACKISEGQKQKIAIARALIKRPKILILDEAFSSMDSESEERIITNMRRDFRDTTFIVVSHRLSTAMAADLVYFLSREGGIIVDIPQNLSQKNKEFSDLFCQQNREL